jgi:DNA-binding SARP family transcriptional activator
VSTLEARVLGPLELAVEGSPVAITGPRQRAVVAALALQANHVVAVSSLIDAVWGEPAPDRAEHSLQQHVSAVRKVLGADHLSTRSPGYVLHVAHLDVDAFEHATTAGLAAASEQRWSDARTAFEQALALWRGPALADARESALLEAAAVRLDEQRLTALEMAFEARLECGQARELVPELEHLVVTHPLRERLRALLMLSLYRAGRQADALAAYQEARRVLIDELGIEPGAALRELEQAILMQSPELERTTRATISIDEVYATFKADARADLGHITLPDGQAFLLTEGTTLIGRDPAAAVRLVDSRVSRRHAEIDANSERCLLRDLASTNGTTINDVAITEQVMQDGDRIGLGGVALVFHSAAR